MTKPLQKYEVEMLIKYYKQGQTGSTYKELKNKYNISDSDFIGLVHSINVILLETILEKM